MTWIDDRDTELLRLTGKCDRYRQAGEDALASLWMSLAHLNAYKHGPKVAEYLEDVARTARVLKEELAAIEKDGDDFLTD